MCVAETLAARFLDPKTFFPLFLNRKLHSVPHQLMHWKSDIFKKGLEEQNCVLMVTNFTNTRLKK